MTAGGLTVGNESPFEARKRPIVGNIDKPTKLAHARHHSISGCGDLFKIVAHDLDTDGKRTAWSLLLLSDAEIGTGETGNQSTHTFNQHCRWITLVPIRKNSADGAD